MDRFPYAEHLNSEEVDYELLIRGQLEASNCELDLAGKQRLLRTLFKADIKNSQNYRSPFNISAEFSHISGWVADLSRSLMRIGVEPRFESRMLHYWYRAKRCQTVTEDQKKMRRELVRRIEECMRTHKIGPPTFTIKQLINDKLQTTNAMSSQGQSDKRHDFDRSLPQQGTKSAKETGTRPKDSRRMHTSTPIETENNLELSCKIEKMEQMLKNLTNKFSAYGLRGNNRRGKEERSDWFFTFVDEFDDWATFEKLIKYRFGNPNQDQGIRTKIQERKQMRGETFIAFVTEIEKLNRMLSKPLSRNRKFEVIWDNMRQHYRSKISIVEVKNLQHLLKLNHRIDAADSNLQQAWEPHPRRPVNNVEVEQSDSESDNLIDVNAMRMRSTEHTKPVANSQYQRIISPSITRNDQSHHKTNDSIRPWTCWNCRQEGHAWRDCTKPKVIFCYGCGNLGRTLRCCERCTTIARPFTHGTQQENL
ncbi:uncharacterized protein LOC131427553 [Malaya genurostris]|uniref:uncharacterized protein LOC131427553 n=1 Tax=Malaya genurostris TaxID=325434 RepID=UPI0026F3D548|nr:uncharacterized protein LOC131427553 [Malaya genurostris]